MLLNLRAAAVAVAEQFGGIINQFSGDDLVMLFGVPTAHDDDAVRGVRAAMAFASDPSKSRYEVFNLGNNRTIGLLEMIRLMEKVLNVDARIDWQDWQPGEMRRTWADITKSRALLGYEPATDFETGLRRFADWLAVQP
mgnify:CR=1 FL=1